MEFIHIARLLKPHGLKGFSFIKLESENSQLKIKKNIYLGEKKSKFQVEALKKSGKKDIIKLFGLDSIEALEGLSGKDVYMKRSDFDQLEKGDFYLSDLLNCDVHNSQNEYIGKVEGFYSNGPQDIVVVTNDKERIEVPLVENFIIHFDHKTRVLKLKVPEII